MGAVGRAMRRASCRGALHAPKSVGDRLREWFGGAHGWAPGAARHAESAVQINAGQNALQGGSLSPCGRGLGRGGFLKGSAVRADWRRGLPGSKLLFLSCLEK